jgi:hypothetical protein
MIALCSEGMDLMNSIIDLFIIQRSLDDEISQEDDCQLLDVYALSFIL